MEKIRDYRCTYENTAGLIPELIGRNGFLLPDAYQKSEYMVQLAKAFQKETGQTFCSLPFCHTLEGEALGGNVQYGDTKSGPRTKSYVCHSLHEVLQLPAIDVQKGRIAETLKAAKTLMEEGYEVVLMLSGSFTILNVLLDSTDVFRGIRKEPELLEQVCHRLGEEVLRIVEAAAACGIHLFSYADSAGSISIIGPKLAGQVVEVFTYDFMRKLEKLAKEDTLIFLCPKTALALLDTNRAEVIPHEITEQISYSEACIRLCGEMTFVGQTCIKSGKQMMKGSVLQELRLV